MTTVSEKAARADASKASALGLIYGMLTSKHRAVYGDELAAWIEEELGGLSKSDVRRFLELEFGEVSRKSRAPDEPLEVWEVAKLLLDSSWLRKGAAGLYSYEPRSYRRWLKSIIEAKHTWGDLSAKSQGLLGASVRYAKLDVVIIGADD